MGLTRDAIQAQLLHHLLATKRPLAQSVMEHDRRDMVLWLLCTVGCGGFFSIGAMIMMDSRASRLSYFQTCVL